MTGLSLWVLGPLAIEYDGSPLTGLTALKARALLVYLALTGQSHSRQTLAGLLWPDVQEESARTSLRTALAQLRKAVGDHVLADRHGLWFNTQRAHWVDEALFVDACRRLPEEPPGGQADRQTLRAAIDLYRGDFLQGFSETHAASFEEWILTQREHYRRLAVNALQALADAALAAHAPEEGIADARRILALDPLREEAYRTLMALHTAAGDTAAALHQYADCVRILDAELGVPPSDETVALAAALREGPRPGGPNRTDARPAGGYQAGESAGRTPLFQRDAHAPVPNNMPAALTTLDRKSVV